ncbi:hypothetical protein D3C79_1041520 [compost metagenome]
MAALADVAKKIHQDDLGAAAADLQTKGKDAICSKPHGHGRLSNTPADAFALCDQAVFFQLADDH